MAVQATTMMAGTRRASHVTKDWINNVAQPTVGDEKIVIINIGGKKFETYEHTLDQFPNTLLGSCERRKTYFDSKKKEYFFERHRSSFTAILYYYQSSGILERPLNVPEHIFLEEIEFFELTDVIQKRNESETKKQLEENSDSNEELPHNKFLKTIWVTFENPNSSTFSKCLAVFSLCIIVLSIGVFCVETLPSLDDSKPITKVYPNGTKTTSPGKKANARVFFGLNAFCTTWFTLELIIRFLVSPNKIRFVKAFLNILDLLSILPFYITLALSGHAGGVGVLRVMRVIRVARIFKLSRHSRGLYILGKTLHSSLNELIMLFLFLLMGVILFASAAYYAEHQENRIMFESIPHSFWWAVVTMTTVGYGDIAPITLSGKLVGTLCALSGVLAIALPVPVIVSNFEYYYKEEMNRKEREERLRNKNEKEDALAGTPTERTISYRSLNQFVPKSPFLERKLLERELRSAHSTPDPLRRRDFSHYSPAAVHKKNGAMKIKPRDAIKEVDEISEDDHTDSGRPQRTETNI
ncbi:potassium voltage-gated channel subfamily A member 7-like [Actinia tenebrosa]|uniref:Potassium voltage-gated channel subfamily A member 7-like n=1 Tax=Actinia tenebrosa TaxID=6105 RepID=A0A6P8HJL5_ACTTE|nr:potassium voltage-gated channel subfamily A member 7-like [Actinia tenebrosa]XP_031555076.1 potassium voltage-gated channel subfamily A member 7-like [Actinia tenebrosa]